MHILLTNDDGIAAPGLFALYQEVIKLGKVTVLAPDHNWSASGHVKTMHRPLRVREAQLADGTTALASDGAPSDCVALAILGLIECQSWSRRDPLWNSYCCDGSSDMGIAWSRGINGST
jgi:5'-nucleotidase